MQYKQLIMWPVSDTPHHHNTLADKYEKWRKSIFWSREGRSLTLPYIPYPAFFCPRISCPLSLRIIDHGRRAPQARDCGNVADHRRRMAYGKHGAWEVGGEGMSTLLT